MFADLIPEYIGLMLTPFAVVGSIVLLGTRRPLANALSLAAAFAVAYGLLSGLFLAVGSEVVPDEDDTIHYVVSLVLGLMFLAAALILAVRKPRPRTGPPRWSVTLENATPGRSFLVGLGLAILNPNIAILLTGITVIVVAEVDAATETVGAATLVIAALIPILLPIAIYVLRGEQGKAQLRSIFKWMMAHDRAITIGTSLFFGVLFAGRALIGLF